jgi:hypothetical protein
MRCIVLWLLSHHRCTAHDSRDPSSLLRSPSRLPSLQSAACLRVHWRCIHTRNAYTRDAYVHRSRHTQKSQTPVSGPPTSIGAIPVLTASAYILTRKIIRSNMALVYKTTGLVYKNYNASHVRLVGHTYLPPLPTKRLRHSLTGEANAQCAIHALNQPFTGSHTHTFRSIGCFVYPVR